MTTKEFKRFLNFLLQNNIIDMMTYNNISIKALPYLKRTKEKSP